MKRRVFVTGFAGLLAAPRAAEAQPAGKVPRIGFLSDSRQPWDEGFRQGLRELGYVAGHNITIEYRYGEGKFERLPGLAAELVRLNVDLVVAGGTQATSSAKQATGVIPIVMGVSADPVGNGFVASLARPGGNITGLTSLSPDLSGKRLALLKEIVPRLSRVSVLWNSVNPDNASQLREAEAAANALGVQLLPIGVRSSNEFDKAFSVINNARADVLYTLGDSLFANNRKRIVDFAAKNQLASMFSTRQAVEAGGLVSYGTDFVDLFRRAAIYVDKILKGAKPADLPIEQPTKFELVINLKTAKALGLTILPSLLLRADQVIE
ncbi:MAG: ABC transporter substrate-binding protein [Candidatus Eisenbacteria bacterium]|uniref:ABC transporter substrate-binding protein n=1 Tax=Eiseniibacteriota bacterium TaxID=2212470 RepID=A0A538SVG6_UNCEI|nr:MAG: ABC transporter substrate-binding protein [Candidatus Eisenbacteria bacterium]